MTLTSVIFSVSIPVPVSPIMVFIPWWSTAAGTTAWPAAVTITARVATSAATTAAAWPPPPVEKIGQTGWKWNKVNLNLCMQCLYPTTKSDPIASAILKDNGVIPVKWEALKLVDLLSVTFLKLLFHILSPQGKRGKSINLPVSVPATASPTSATTPWTGATSVSLTVSFPISGTAPTPVLPISRTLVLLLSLSCWGLFFFVNLFLAFFSLLFPLLLPHFSLLRQGSLSLRVLAS